jgi:hypothetical protein
LSIWLLLVVAGVQLTLVVQAAQVDSAQAQDWQ